MNIRVILYLTFVKLTFVFAAFGASVLKPNLNPSFA